MQTNYGENKTFKILDQVVEHSQAGWILAVFNILKFSNFGGLGEKKASVPCQTRLIVRTINDQKIWHGAYVLTVNDM